MENEFEYLAKRAELFIEFLDINKIENVFIETNFAKEHLGKIIQSGSIRRIKILNSVIDNIIIGKNSMTIEQRKKLLLLFNTELNEISLIDKKIQIFKDILNKGIIKSRNQINDAIEIANSEILGLSENEKLELHEIILESMSIRIK
jgi:hypothetical protein